LGGELLHTMDKPEPAFRCGASRFSSHVRVHGLPAIGRPHQDAGDAACRTPRVAATSKAAGVGREGDLESGDAVDEQPIPRPVIRRREPAGGEARGRAPSSWTPAGEQLRLARNQRLEALGCRGDEGSGQLARRRSNGDRL
jgi:hypothetical protein